jgi:hypothetical protein
MRTYQETEKAKDDMETFVKFLAENGEQGKAVVFGGIACALHWVMDDGTGHSEAFAKLIDNNDQTMKTFFGEN